MPRTYLDAGAAALGSALTAGLAVATVDAFMTAGSVPGAGFFALLLPTLGLYALPVTLFGLVTGAVAGAVSATFGPSAPGRLWRRLLEDRALDTDLTAGIVAAGAVALVVAGLVAVLSLMLVAGVERSKVGAVLAGAAIAGSLPFLIALGLPVYRAARAPARLIPRFGPLPGSVLLVLLAAGAGLLAAAWYVRGHLDWRALNLSGYVLAAAFPVIAALVAFVAYGPLDRARTRIPRRGLMLLVAAVTTLALVPLTLGGQPNPKVAAALAEQSVGARILLGAARKFIDHDKDGVSPFFGGPDCDDTRADVKPDGKEIPGNGIDENCLDGDRPATAADRTHAAGNPATPPTPATRRADSVILLAIDTLRADRLGVAGYKRDGKSLTPNLDRLAAESVYFTHARAHAPNTPRSFPSIFTSRFPSQVVTDKEFANYSNPLEDNVTLFEALKAGGIGTSGVASHFYWQRAPGITQGFDAFDDEGALDIAGSNHDSAAPRITPRVEARLAELAGKKERFALFVHLFEPHSTYMEHDGFPITESGTAALEQKYDYEIAFVDGFVGRILDAIDKNGLRDHTLLVMISDHGEGFGIHKVAGQRMFFHGQTLYDELLRVPVMVRLPGAAPSVADDPIGLMDVGPTILDALGLSVPAEMNGRSVLPRALGQPLQPRPSFAQLLPAPSWNHKWMSMVSPDGKYKLIYRMSDRAFELYDLAADPTEQQNLYDSQPEVAARLRDDLTRWIEVDLPQ